ncbi:hypothetical protein [Piscirickettsia salmonis]|uniref:hypothetical protein n=1 Tax=Piscirickettsia salmonis TaxID=1238 RepID=UPI0012BA92C5|nr:hypothetical protein [Piscirickettsia salmonis]
MLSTPWLAAVDYAVKAHALSGNKACKMCRIGRSVYRYQPKKQVVDTKIKKVLTDLAKIHPLRAMEC